MARTIAILAAAIALTATVAPNAHAAGKGLDLMKQSDCLACHSFKLSEPKKLGPSFEAVSKKYKNDKTAPAKLADKVKKGGGGNWGAMAMSPHPALSAGDLNAMVDWILKEGGK
ncbi:c-type cytochrome [bacterium]|nr:c-type cytochrome [bacterium]